MFTLEEILEIKLCLIIQNSQCQNLLNEINWKLNHHFANNPEEEEELKENKENLIREIRKIKNIKNRVNNQ